MGRPSSIGVLATCIALVITTSGCGGGGSSGNQSTATTTRAAVTTLDSQAQFVSQLVALCTAGNRLASRQTTLAQALKASQLTKARAIVRSIETQAEAFYRRLEGVTPSAQDRAPFLRYLLLTHRYFGVNERLAAALHARAAAEVARLAGLAQAVADRRTETASQLGLTRCGA